jgi:hypothetical protein
MQKLFYKTHSQYQYQVEIVQKLLKTSIFKILTAYLQVYASSNRPKALRQTTYQLTAAVANRS